MEKFIIAAEELDWNVNETDEGMDIQKYSDEGQDFNISLEGDLIEALERHIEGYDISEEASLWLDDTGHGMNGAPYAMIDVYNDMRSCFENMEELLVEWRKI